MTEAISPSIGERQRAGLAAVVLLLAAAVLFGFLGKWQLARGEQQRILETAADSALHMPPLDLRTAPVFEHDAWRNAVAEGTYDPSHQFYLQGRQHEGRGGYHVITALRVAGTRRYVLVNRGWLSNSQSTATVPAGRVQVKGVLTRPQLPPLRLGEPSGMTRPYIDPAAYARETERSVLPLILMAEQGGSELVPVAATPGSKRSMHLGYALQWFAFAAFAVGAAAVVLFRRLRHGP